MDRAFLRDVPLPAGVTLEGLFDGMSKTVDATPLRLQNGLDLSGLIQANTMSGIISNVFTVMLKQSMGSGHRRSEDGRSRTTHGLLGDRIRRSLDPGADPH